MFWMTVQLYDLFVPIFERFQANRALLDLLNILFGLGPTQSVRLTDGVSFPVSNTNIIVLIHAQLIKHDDAQKYRYGKNTSRVPNDQVSFTIFRQLKAFIEHQHPKHEEVE